MIEAVLWKRSLTRWILRRESSWNSSLGVEDSRSARHLARGRDNFTISVELPAALFLHIRQLAKLSAKTGMTADEEGQLNTLLEPVFREEVQEFLPDLVLK